mmetsp:Transcript_63895/g.114514  ORF Transcript_63895/g.114514 Transcript_63895/m.114514 type:complete len:250 (-) Transcript_63895:593-1342(-)
MSHHGSHRQAKLVSQCPHLILEQQPERFNDLHLHSIREAAHIVMSLDDAGRAFVGRRLNHVWVQGALQQQALLMRQAHLRNCLFESFDEEPANDLAFLLWLFDSSQLLVEVQTLIQHLEFHARDVLLQALLDNLGLVFTKKTRIDHKGSEAISNRFVDQCRSHRGVDAAAHGTHDVLVLQLVHDDIDLLLAEIVHVPFALAANHLQAEVLDHGCAAGGVGNLRMKLHAIEVASLVLHRRVLCVGGVGDG